MQNWVLSVMEGKMEMRSCEMGEMEVEYFRKIEIEGKIREENWELEAKEKYYQYLLSRKNEKFINYQSPNEIEREKGKRKEEMEMEDVKKVVNVGGKEFKFSKRSLGWMNSDCLIVTASNINKSFFDRSSKVFELIYTKMLGKSRGEINSWIKSLGSLDRAEVTREVKYFNIKGLDESNGVVYSKRFPTYLIGKENLRIKSEEDRLRNMFVVERTNELLDDPFVGLQDIFNVNNGKQSLVKLLNTKKENKELPYFFDFEKEKFKRFHFGPTYIVPSMKEFLMNFRDFTQGMLAKMDFSNMFVAGGSVLACLTDAVRTLEEEKEVYSQNSIREFNDRKIIYLMQEKLRMDKEDVSFLDIEKRPFLENLFGVAHNIDPAVVLQMFRLNWVPCSSARFHQKKNLFFSNGRIERRRRKEEGERNGRKGAKKEKREWKDSMEDLFRVHVPVSVQYFLSTEFGTNNFKFKDHQDIRFFKLSDLEDGKAFRVMKKLMFAMDKTKKGGGKKLYQEDYSKENLESIAGWIPIAFSTEVVVFTVLTKDAPAAVVKNFPVVVYDTCTHGHTGPFQLSHFVSSLYFRSTGYVSGKDVFKKEDKILKERQQFHTFIQKYYRNSDLDIFFYGIDEKKALEKIQLLHQTLKASLQKKGVGKDGKKPPPDDMLIFRTKYSITFQFGAPKKSIQCILRIYKSPSEILTGFDIDSCCVGTDMKAVYCTERSKRAIISSYNLVDNDRQSKSYVKRLVKYAKRGFRVAVPGYDEGFVKREGLLERKLGDVAFNYDYSISVNEGNCFGLAKLIFLENKFRVGVRERGKWGGKKECRWNDFHDYGSKLVVEPSYLNIFIKPLACYRRLDSIYNHQFKYQKYLKVGRENAELELLKLLYSEFSRIEQKEDEEKDDFEDFFNGLFDTLKVMIHEDFNFRYENRAAVQERLKIKTDVWRLISTFVSRSDLERVNELARIRNKYVGVKDLLLEESNEVMDLGYYLKKKIEEDNEIKGTMKHEIVYSLNDITPIMDFQNIPKIRIRCSLPFRPTFVLFNPGSQALPVVKSSENGKQLVTGSFHPIQKLNFLEDAYLSHKELLDKHFSVHGRWAWLYETTLDAVYNYEFFTKFHSCLIEKAYQKNPEGYALHKFESYVGFKIDLKAKKILIETDYAARFSKVKRVKTLVF